jgi:uroporphyrinogen-III synthase
MAARDLTGCTVVVTRPSGQAESLLKRLASAGANPIPFPVIAIQALPVHTPDAQTRQQVAGCDLAIFISRNAVRHGLPVIEQAGGLAPGVRVAAVGKGTAEELDRHGVHVDLLPSRGASSEALLAVLADDTISGKQVLIVRGVGGRELLADTLKSRGACVDYLECYQRVLPDTDAHILPRLHGEGQVDAIVVTSLEGLRNLERLVPDTEKSTLRSVRLYVVSAAMVDLCADLGYKLKPVLMDSPSDDDIMTALQMHCRDEYRPE